MAYSRCADIGFIRRENLRLDEDCVQELEVSGTRKNSRVLHGFQEAGKRSFT